MISVSNVHLLNDKCFVSYAGTYTRAQLLVKKTDATIVAFTQNKKTPNHWHEWALHRIDTLSTTFMA